MNLRKLLIPLLLLLASLGAQGQIHPVQLNVRLVPPYSVFLADYATNGQLQVTLLQCDLNEPNYALRLRMEVQLGSNVIMRTSAQFNPAPIHIAPGAPALLSAADLLPYLEPRNLDFIGFSRSLYEQTKALPEGAYTLRFIAYDYYRPNVAVSAPAESFYFLAKAEPPILNLPYNGQQLAASEGVPIQFQWLPRNTGSLNSSVSAAYRFELFEIRPAGQNPNIVAQSNRPVLTAETDLPFYLHTPADPALEPNMAYAWRVQAFDRDGRDAFLNRGYSEVFYFTYGQALPSQPELYPIGELSAKAIDSYSAQATWQAGSYDSYTLSYRKAGSGGEWFTTTAADTTATIGQLEESTTYECRVQGSLGGRQGPMSGIVEFKTPARTPQACGDPADLPKKELGEAIADLTSGTVVRVGYFLLKIEKASGGSGRFTGTGQVFIPFLNGVGVAVSFSNIYINKAYEVTDGQVVAEGIPIEEWIAKQINQQGIIGAQTPKGDVQPDFRIGSPDSITVTDKDGNPLTPKPDSPDQVVEGPFTIRVKDEQGVEHSYPVERLPATVTDSEGNTYKVGSDGKVSQLAATSGGATGATPEQKQNLGLKNARADFEQADSYAFDTFKPDYGADYLAEFELLKDNTNTQTYPVPFKLMEAGKPSAVRAVVRFYSNAADTAKLSFITGSNLLIKPTKVEKLDDARYAYTLELPPLSDRDGLELYAMLTPQANQHYCVGKLRAVAYARKAYSVALVPVGKDYALSQAAAQAQEMLSAVYAPLAVDFTVSVAPVFSGVAEGEPARDWEKNPLTVQGSGLFATLTSDMRALERAYRAQHSVDPNTAYLFVLPKADSATVGDMPRGRQFGFLFNSMVAKDKDGYGWLTAHELGHGLFTLRHSWSYTDDDRSKLPDNLMNYHGGAKLTKFQWDLVHQPEDVADLWKSDEEGMQQYTTCSAEAPRYNGSRENEATLTFGEVYTAYDGLLKDKKRSVCYKVWYWNTQLKKWLSKDDYASKTNTDKGTIGRNSNGEYIEYTIPFDAGYNTASNNIDKEKRYSLTPLSSILTESEVYQLAFLRAFQPDDFKVEEDYYIDLKFLEEQSKVHYYFTNSADIHLSLSTEAGRKASEEIHTIVAAALFSSSKDSIAEAIKIIKWRTNTFNKFSWGLDAAVMIIPINAAENKLLEKLSSNISRTSFRNGTLLQKRITTWIERFRIGTATKNEVILEKYKVSIIDKVKIVQKDESLPLWIKESFLDNYYYTAETIEDINVFRRFGGTEDQAKLFGGFLSTEAVLNRSELAILKKWSTMQFEAELVVSKGAKLNLGKIAPQSKYSGGADQVLLPQNYPETWVKNIKDLKTGKIYNLEEFRIAFPDQVYRK